MVLNEQLSNYFGEIKSLRSQKFDFFKMFVIDIGFLLSILIIAFVFNYIIKYFVNKETLLLLLFIIYLLILVLIYSFFKLLLISQIKETNIINNIKPFYLLNLFNSFLIFIIWILISVITKGVNESFQFFVFIVILTIFGILIFVHMNISQRDLLNSNKIIDSIKNGLKQSVNVKGNKQVWFGVILFVIFFMLFMLIGWLLGYSNLDVYNTEGLSRFIGPLLGLFVLAIFYILFTITRYLLIKNNN